MSASNITESSPIHSPNPFHAACSIGDIKRAQSTFHPDYVYESDANGNTPLHVASKNGHIDIILLLFRYYSDVSRRNKQGFTAEELANDAIKQIFQTNSNEFISRQGDLEWIDSYKNAHRIAYENREHLKRWILKVPSKDLLEKFSTDYIDQLKVDEGLSAYNKEKIQQRMNSIKKHQIINGLITMCTATYGFFQVLNKNLAEIGSNFRFLSTQDSLNPDYLDNEPPHGLGQYIYAAFIMNHPAFDHLYSLNLKPELTTYRGMNITENDLKQYHIGDFVLTRSFLSTSINEKVAKQLRPNDLEICQKSCGENRLPVLCEYTICNSRSALNLISKVLHSPEAEILIVPFTVFQITDIIKPEDNNGYVVIKLKEQDSNLPA